MITPSHHKCAGSFRTGATLARIATPAVTGCINPERTNPSVKAMIRRRLLEAFDLCAVPVMALALAIASTQCGAPGRERTLNRKAGAAAGGEVMMPLTDLPY